MRLITSNLKALLGLSLAILLPLTATSASAAVIGTSFENESAGTQQLYQDTGDPSTDHDLVNYPPFGRNVDSTSTSVTAGDLGFNARVVNTRIGEGMTDGATVGIDYRTQDVGAYTDGIQGYKFADTDDLMVLEFDPVSIILPTLFEMDYFFSLTSYEADDVVRIFLTIDGSTVIPILDSTGLDINNLGVEGLWTTGSADLTGLGSSAVLTVSVDTNASFEEIYIDNVRFTSVPEPSSIVMAGLAGLSLGLVALRRRKK